MLGPCCWVMVSEIFPLQIRSRGMAVSTCMNRLTAGIVALTFLSIEELLTPIGTWILFGCISIIALLFVYRYVPETKNKTLEEITNSLLYGVSYSSVTDTEDVIPSEIHEIRRNEFEENGRDRYDSKNKLEMVNYYK